MQKLAPEHHTPTLQNTALGEVMFPGPRKTQNRPLRQSSPDMVEGLLVADVTIEAAP